MSTIGTARPKRKLNLSPLTVRVLWSAGPKEPSPDAPLSTNQTQQASCGGDNQGHDDSAPSALSQPPPQPRAPGPQRKQ
jgi:hypothetical protein